MAPGAPWSLSTSISSIRATPPPLFTPWQDTAHGDISGYKPDNSECVNEHRHLLDQPGQRLMSKPGRERRFPGRTRVSLRVLIPRSRMLGFPSCDQARKMRTLVYGVRIASQKRTPRQPPKSGTTDNNTTLTLTAHGAFAL